MIVTSMRLRETGISAMAAIALFGLCVCGNALAAGSSHVFCDRSVQDIQSLGVTLEALSIDRVDHFPSDSRMVSSDPLQAAEASINNISPLLSLSPRVESLLDEVFATDAATPHVTTTPIKTPGDSASNEPKKQVTQFSGHPGIDMQSEHKTAPVASEMTIEDEIESGELRSLMFRRDI